MSFWLSGLGFEYNPFEHLEASSDANLASYIVGLELFAAAWDAVPSLIFAPTGGGKTAMRMYTMQQCWVSMGHYHPFPISYYFPNYLPTPQNLSREAHLSGIIQAAATSLLIGLTFRPERLLESNDQVQQKVAQFLNSFLPNSLSYYLARLDQHDSPNALSALLDPSYLLPISQKKHLVGQLSALLRAHLQGVNNLQLDPEQRFEWVADLLLKDLGFRSIFILTDGIDSYPETYASPILAAQTVAPLLEAMPEWESKRIYFKGFFPLEDKSTIIEYLPVGFNKLNTADIEWDIPKLASLIQRRVYHASKGMFGSLDAVCSPELRDVEATLARLCVPLPREILALTQKILEEYYDRTRGLGTQIEIEDIENAKDWYNENKFNPEYRQVELHSNR
jgi:hypothetical protein